jgi:DNA polymerase III delta prime subunit
MRSFEERLADLEASVRRRRGHAYLVEVSRNDERRVLDALRRAFLCTHPDGQSCRACTGAPHPDWTEIELGSARSIGRAEVADFPTRALVPPLLAPVRVFVVRDADRMTPEASNLLLKLVEEPPDPVVVVLTTDGVHDVLPTLRSRCRWVAFRDPSPGAVSTQAPDWSQPDWAESLGPVSEGLRAQVRALEGNSETARRLIGQWDAVVSAALDLEQNANREIVRRRLEFCFDRG